MKCRILKWTIGASMALTAGTFASAQPGRAIYLNGLLNDYTPATINGQTVGPWEVHGKWWMEVSRDGEHASFSAALTMEHSDQGVTLAGGGDFDTPAGRHAHTHHIVLEHGTVVAVKNGFQVTGMATITGNGSIAPDFGPISPVTIVVTGGPLVPFSNMQITVGDPADLHFGKNPLHGVVLQKR